jgi:hypothetical protein
LERPDLHFAPVLLWLAEAEFAAVTEPKRAGD